MSDFVRHELHIRPILPVDAQQEDVVIRRGVPPRQLSGLSLPNEHVLGMQGGQLVGLPYHWWWTSCVIQPLETKEVSRTAANCRSRQWKIDIDAPHVDVDEDVLGLTFNTMARVKTSEILFSKFGHLGDKIPHVLNMELVAGEIIVTILNRYALPITVNTLIIG